MAEKVVGDAEELPKAIVRRIVKEKLSQISPKDGADFTVLREALQAFSESSRIFIHYLSATANDICKEAKRQTISADDVFKALEEIEFPEFVEPLRASLEEFRQKNAGKKAVSSKAKEAKQSKKEPATENGVEEHNDAMEEEHVDAIEEEHVDPIEEEHVDAIEEEHNDITGEEHNDAIEEDK